jgi:hypothetical protein
LDVSTALVDRWFDQGDLSGWRVPGSGHRRVGHRQLLKFLADYGVACPALTTPQLGHLWLSTAAAASVSEFGFEPVTAFDLGVLAAAGAVRCLFGAAHGAAAAAQTVKSFLAAHPHNVALVVWPEDGGPPGFDADRYRVETRTEPADWASAAAALLAMDPRAASARDRRLDARARARAGRREKQRDEGGCDGEVVS